MTKQKAVKPCDVHDLISGLVDLLTEPVVTTAPCGAHAEPIVDLLNFRKKYLQQEVFSKFSGVDTASTDVRRARAIDKWLRVELRNSRTNHRILIEDTMFFGKFSSDSILDKAAEYIREVLGCEVPHNLYGGFTNGASTSTVRSEVSKAHKLTEQVHVTRDAAPFVIELLLRNAVGWFIHPLREKTLSFVPGNVLFTVPKNAEIDRVACKEPDLNLWGQKAIGNYIRRRLLKHGIDLNDQSNNSALAREGSITGSHATLDLSSASDSLTCSLVCRLLPTDWFVVMNALRSAFTQIDGVMHENQMFSSMGNGFTFELETLIFWALARSVSYHLGVKGRILVYGDDIVVPTACARLMIQVLGFCGFVTNSKKTSITGVFRESCGGHWYAGIDVKPIYIRRVVKQVQDVILYLNQLRRWYNVERSIRQEWGLPPLTRFEIQWYRVAKSFVDKRLWGGRFLDRTTSLVTNHRLGSLELVRSVSRRKRLYAENVDGLYLSALETPSGVPTVTSSSSFAFPSWVSVPSGYVLRRREYDYWALVEDRKSVV